MIYASSKNGGAFDASILYEVSDQDVQDREELELVSQLIRITREAGYLQIDVQLFLLTTTRSKLAGNGEPTGTKDDLQSITQYVSYVDGLR